MELCSTHPAFIALRYDFVGKQFPQAKIFLRSLLYSTGKRVPTVAYVGAVARMD
jgi:hypothetical protein